MAVVPVPRTWTNGEFVTDTIMNATTGVRDALNFILAPPRCDLRQTAAQSIGNGAWTALTFTTEDADTDSMHDTVTNTDRITVQTAGWYRLTGSASWAVTGSVVRNGARWTKNGVAISGGGVMLSPLATGSGYGMAAATTDVFLAVNDIVRLEVFQTAAATRLTSVVAELQSTAAVRWIAP
jgi:hypothetical protein